ncbi:MAG: septum formation initiator family protein [Balneolaceae bacterium]|nr:septum formation initiator family protein [Balneolaceae bacterium]
MKLEILNPLRWKKSVLFSLLVAFVIVWFSFIDVYSLRTRWELSQRKNELKQRTDELHVKSDVLKVKLESLESDPALLEKIAREQYGMRKPGETVYKIKTKK